MKTLEILANAASLKRPLTKSEIIILKWIALNDTNNRKEILDIVQQ